MRVVVTGGAGLVGRAVVSLLRGRDGASAGVTDLASSAKARTELAFSARDIETGLRDAFGAAAPLPPAG